MIICKATLEDFPQIDAFDVFALDRKAEINRGEILVAIIDDKIAGYITHNKNFYGGAFVQFVCVNDCFKKMGVAKALFAEVEKLYKEAGNKIIFSSTEDDNEIMLGFFERNNWKRSGIIYNIQKQAEIVFIKRLIDSDEEFQYYPQLYK